MRLLVIGLVSVGLALLGIRLLRLSRRTGALPEFWLGLAFAFAGPSAGLLPLAATEGMATPLARTLAFTAQAGMTAAVACLVVFTWRVFRADSALARWLFGALIAANVLAGAAVLFGDTPIPVGRVGLAVILVRSFSLLWLFFESARYARKMRRRVRLGLGDAIVANRFALWSIWTGAIACIPLFVLLLRVLGVLVEVAPGDPIPGPVRAILAVIGLAGAAALGAGWLAFFPPAAYQRWIASQPKPAL